jgi:hypothetical protein
MMAIAAGGAPLDSAKIVSADVIPKLFFVVLVQARHCRLCPCFNELLKQLQPHLPHGRNLLSQFLQLASSGEQSISMFIFMGRALLFADNITIKVQSNHAIAENIRRGA